MLRKPCAKDAEDHEQQQHPSIHPVPYDAEVSHTGRQTVLSHVCLVYIMDEPPSGTVIAVSTSSDAPII